MSLNGQMNAKKGHVLRASITKPALLEKEGGQNPRYVADLRQVLTFGRGV